MTSVSALTKMYLWRRRCIYEGVSADEDVFMKAKMYLWRCQRWRRCIYEGEDVFMKVSALMTKMYLWRRRCIYEGGQRWRADKDVFMKAKMYSWRWGVLVSADMSALGALTCQLGFCSIYLYFPFFPSNLNKCHKFNFLKKVITQYLNNKDFKPNYQTIFWKMHSFKIISWLFSKL